VTVLDHASDHLVCRYRVRPVDQPALVAFYPAFPRFFVVQRVHRLAYLIQPEAPLTLFSEKIIKHTKHIATPSHDQIYMLDDQVLN
jgi:hypothetical protein